LVTIRWQVWVCGVYGVYGVYVVRVCVCGLVLAGEERRVGGGGIATPWRGCCPG